MGFSKDIFSRAGRHFATVKCGDPPFDFFSPGGLHLGNRFMQRFKHCFRKFGAILLAQGSGLLFDLLQRC